MLLFSTAGGQLTDIGNVGSVGLIFQMGVLGVFTFLWLTKRIGVIDDTDRDYLRQKIERLEALVEKREEYINELQDSVRKDVVPALTDVARILPIIVDRLTK